MLKEYFTKLGWKRVCFSILGNVFIGMGVSIFKLARLGNDAYNGMIMSLSDCLEIQYGGLFAIISIFLFAVQIIAGRDLIGVGTLINALLQGYIASFFYNLWLLLHLEQSEMVIQIIVMCVGVVIVGLGLSMYQSADAGVSPYDSLSLILAKRITKIPYFWWRIATDAVCAFICFITGGLIGIGMLVGTFGFGPVIAFFNKHLMSRLLKE